MSLEEAQAAYAEALEHLKDGSWQSVIGAQQAAINLQNAEHSAEKADERPAPQGHVCPSGWCPVCQSTL